MTHLPADFCLILAQEMLDSKELAPHLQKACLEFRLLQTAPLVDIPQLFVRNESLKALVLLISTALSSNSSPTASCCPKCNSATTSQTSLQFEKSHPYLNRDQEVCLRVHLHHLLTRLLNRPAFSTQDKEDQAAVFATIEMLLKAAPYYSYTPPT